MKLAIIGAGAMGSLLGFYLCAEAEVWLLDPWQAHVDAMNAGGLVCELTYPFVAPSPDHREALWMMSTVAIAATLVRRAGARATLSRS